MMHQLNFIQKPNGFTIVELLIVVVVIAVLAAITIVSYNGITARSNESSIKSHATTVQKKSELYLAEVSGKYPVQTSDLTADITKSYYVPSASLTYVTFPASGTAAVPNSTNLPSDSNTTKRLLVLKCHSTTPSAANDTQAEVTSSLITGLQIWYLNPRSGAIESVNVGGAGAWSTSYCPQA